METLPIIRRNQARSKMFIIILLQIFAVLTPALIYISNPRFLGFLLAYLSTLPLVLTFSMTTFLLRIHFFGKKRYYYILDEILPENKIGKWLLILVINYLIYAFFNLISYYLFYLFDFIFFFLNESFLSLILILILKGKFDKYFPKKSKINWSLIIAIMLIYCYIFAHLLLLNSIISIPLHYVIPIVFLSLTGFILILKYVKISKQFSKKKLKKVKPRTVEKKITEKTNWTFILLVISIMFFTYSLIPRFIFITSITYSSVGLIFIIIGLSLILKMLKSKKQKST